MQIYVDLFYNNLEGVCARTFKTLRSMLEDAEWHRLVRAFLDRHTSTTPYFREIGKEFVKFLVNENWHEEEYPFIGELCHFESLELEMSLAVEDLPESLPSWVSLDQTICASPLAKLLSYEWPVHEIKKQQKRVEPEAGGTWLITYRNRNDEVDFLTSNARTFRLLEHLQVPKTGRKLLEELSREFRRNEDELTPAITPILESLTTKDVILVCEPEN